MYEKINKKQTNTNNITPTGPRKLLSMYLRVYSFGSILAILIPV